MDLLFLRLDSMAVISVTEEGFPKSWQLAQLDPEKTDPPYTLSPLLRWDDLSYGLGQETKAVEAAFLERSVKVSAKPKAILVSVSSEPKGEQEKHLAELAELAKTAGIEAESSLIQRTASVHPHSILGKGKIAELEVLALKHNADTLLFDGELTPAQLHNLADITERRVLDRTQLILDIFAQHATTKAGKLQVELAQLKYLQPRLAGKNKALDRLMGGIGGRGPGETRLETDRRKNRERIALLRKELATIANQRAYVRARRKRKGLPLAALVGYTNAGKSTLLNSLSKSHVLAEDKLFATLDPVSRRLRFPEEREIIFADTIGFIRNLPDELLEAFQATLDALYDADLLLHVVDAASAEFAQHIRQVNDILEKLSVTSIPTLLIFNKWDLVSQETKEILSVAYPTAIPVSAALREGLAELNRRILSSLFHRP